MGIKGLNKFLREKFPEIFEEINISTYAFKKIAIDISLFLCKYKVIFGDKWLSSFIHLITFLRKNEIHCIIIYDGKAPIEKSDEQKKRRDVREKNEMLVNILERDLEIYYETEEVSDALYEIYEKYNNDEYVPSLRSKGKSSRKINIQVVEYIIRKRRQQLFSITPSDFELTRELFDVFKIPYYIAPSEAETTCSDLCKRGLVDAILSDDSDIFAYGAPFSLMKLDISNGQCIQVNYDNLLCALEFTNNEFLDFCILCGTDYNKNIPLVGPVKAYNLIKKHQNIETIADKTEHNIKILNHENVRNLFRGYTRNNIKISYCGQPNMFEIEKFLFKHNIRVDIEMIKKAFQNTILFV